ETRDRQPAPGLFASLTRLALPTALGEQAPLLDHGLDAVTISSAGERPLPPTDSASGISERTLGAVRRPAPGLRPARDAERKPRVRGPSTYVLAGGKVVPGWAPILLALALMFPSGLVAGAALGRAWQRGEAGPRAIAWALGRAFPFLGVLVLSYLLA